MPNILRNLKIKRVALVDTPANQGAQITLWKRASGARERLEKLHAASQTADVCKAAERAYELLARLGVVKSHRAMRVLKALSTSAMVIAKDEHEPATFEDVMFTRKLRAFWSEMDTHMGALQETVDSIVTSDAVDKQELVGAAVTSFVASIGTALMAAIQMAGEDVEKSGLHMIRDILQEAGMPDDPKELAAQKAAEEASVKKAAEAAVAKKVTDDAAAKQADDAAAQKAAMVDDVQKQLGDLRKQLEESTARLKVAEEVAKSERDIRVLKEFETICQRYAALGIDPVKDALIFKAMAEKDAAGWARTLEVFKRQLEVLKTSAIFSELGTGLRDGSEAEKSPGDQIDILAKAKIAKNDKLTYRAAVDQTMAENPALTDAYRRGGRLQAETEITS